MSCGNPHSIDCAAVLAALDAYLDGEDSALDRVTIAEHLRECGPCLQEEHIDRLIRARVARACGLDACSAEVRARVVTRIREVQVSVTFVTEY